MAALDYKNTSSDSSFRSVFKSQAGWMLQQQFFSSKAAILINTKTNVTEDQNTFFLIKEIW